jgi:uncharacterized protein
MPGGKPAGVRCVQLDDAHGCLLFGHPDRPAVCASLQPAPEMCGASRDHAMAWLAQLELQTTPGWTRLGKARPPAPESHRRQLSQPNERETP